MLSSGFLVACRVAMKARFGWYSFLQLAVLAVVAFLVSLFSPRQPAAVALDVGFSFVKISLPFLMIFLVQELFSREFDRRYGVNSFSYPRSRSFFLIERFLVVQFFFFWQLILSALVLAGVVWWVGLGYGLGGVALDQHYFAIFCFFSIDFLVLSSFAVFLSIFASTPSFVVVGVIGFMLVSRSFSSVVNLLVRDGSLVANTEVYRSGIGMLGYIFPDLGALDVRMAALYGYMHFVPDDWGWLVVSNLGYGVALLSLAGLGLFRKRFS